MASTLDPAITGLVALLQVAPALSGVSVFDGVPTEETPEWVAVGWSPGETTAADITYDWAQIGAQRHEEQYDLLCSLATSSGDSDLPTRRGRAIALRDAVAAVLTANPTLSGAVRVAHMTRAQLVQELPGTGSSAGFTFRVSCQARVTS